MYFICQSGLDKQFITFVDTGFTNVSGDQKLLTILSTVIDLTCWPFAFISLWSRMLNNSSILFSDCKELDLTHRFYNSKSLWSKEKVTAGSCVLDHFCDSILFLLGL